MDGLTRRNGRFRLFVGTALDGGYEEVLSRVIVQIYYEDMYDEVMSVYPFEKIRFRFWLCHLLIGMPKNKRSGKQ